MPKITALCLLVLIGVSTSFGKEAIVWRSWSPAVFAEAGREHKFVLLDLEAVWCHWCHVMDKETYSDPKVIALINARYIALRVDQDARPDLSNRYEDYGWPATVVFAADGSEIVKRQGYLPPQEMASMLQAIIADPSPGPSVTNAARGSLAASSDSQTLRQALLADFDHTLGGWDGPHKYLDADNVEYLLSGALDGDADAEAMARKTLAGALKLIDPVWGGADQYSIDDWDHPHFEKLIQVQAEDMRIFALAYAALHDPVYLAAAKKIHGYVASFLTSPDGAVYTSQDADIVDGQAPEPYYALDDSARRKAGLPRVDRHLYARENGWWIEALCQLGAVTGDGRYRDEAVRDARWIIAHRMVPGGGFRHGETPDSALYLGDTLFMGRAFLALAQVTADPAWMKQSVQAAEFIRMHFSPQTGTDGFITAAKSTVPGGYEPQPEYDENVSLARWANLLAHETGLAVARTMAGSALRYARSNAVARFAYVGGYLLAQAEAQGDPLHVVVISRRDDAAGRDLFFTAIGEPIYNKQIEWLDPGRPMNAGELSIYPHLDRAAAFLCANQTCSPPVFTHDGLLKLLARIKAP